MKNDKTRIIDRIEAFIDGLEAQNIDTITKDTQGLPCSMGLLPAMLSLLGYRIRRNNGVIKFFDYGKAQEAEE